MFHWDFLVDDNQFIRLLIDCDTRDEPYLSVEQSVYCKLVLGAYFLIYIYNDNGNLFAYSDGSNTCRKTCKRVFENRYFSSAQTQYNRITAQVVPTRCVVKNVFFHVNIKFPEPHCASPTVRNGYWRKTNNSSAFFHGFLTVLC